MAVTVWVLAVTAPVQGHYHILLLDKPSAARNDEVAVVYCFGHPFEQELFDPEAPESAVVLTPAGKTIDLAKQLKNVAFPGADGKTGSAYRCVYQPRERGDHVFLFSSPPVWMPEEKHFLQDRTKAVLHVETQHGWEREVAPGKAHATVPAQQWSELLPLTRPYGLTPGEAFRVEMTGLSLRDRAAPADTECPRLRALVEWERFNPVPPEVLPPDEHITRSARTDAVGTATVTLASPGWWCITGVKRAGLTRERDGKPYPVVQRATLWVHVDEPRPRSGE